MTHALDNPAWTALTTMQADLALGDDLARRYPADMTVIGAVARPEPVALNRLADLVADDDWISLPATFDGVEALIRAPFVLKFTRTLVQMVCERHVAMPASDADVCRLSDADLEDMVALAALTNPGPFRPHTYRFGSYLGIRVGGVLAAMGGQRMHLPGYKELSAICTHPGFRGRGYARAIVGRLAAATFDEGLTPFLHVQDENTGAQALYATLGFVERARLPVVVVDRPALHR